VLVENHFIDEDYDDDESDDGDEDKDEKCDCVKDERDDDAGDEAKDDYHLPHPHHHRRRRLSITESSAFRVVESSALNVEQHQCPRHEDSARKILMSSTLSVDQTRTASLTSQTDRNMQPSVTGSYDVLTTVYLLYMCNNNIIIILRTIFIVLSS